MEGEVHQRERIAGLRVDYRIVRVFGQHVALARDLGLDLRDRRIGVIVELHEDLDDRDPLTARRLHEIDAVRFGNRLLQRRGDESLDQLAAGARVGRRHPDQGVFGLRILAQLERLDRAQAEHQDHQAHDAREHRPADEQVGYVHGLVVTPAAAQCSAISTGMPLRSLL